MKLPAIFKKGKVMQPDLEMVVEDRCLSDFTFTETVHSKITPNKLVTRRKWLECPMCSLKQEPMRHGETRTCVCGLEMFSAGNLLRIRALVEDNTLKIIN